MRTLVLDKHKQPLMPCRNARARKLLSSGKAAVYRRYPFTIILLDRSGGDTQPISLNVDPGSKETGMALVAEYQKGSVCLFALNLKHQGHRIKESLDSRRAVRRGRRARKTRYRQPRFLNRTRAKGWLPPSLMSRVHNVETWAQRLRRVVPITRAQVETVRFDLQLLENPDIHGVLYQRGELLGFELREYLLYRHSHTCVYCRGLSGDAILEMEHIVPRCKGGTDRLANLVIACHTCNQHKGAEHPRRWADRCGSRKNKLDQSRSASMSRILSGYRPTLKDATAVNATRYAVGRVIKALIEDVRFWSGGRTKKNRTEQGYRKDHWIDAACIGAQGNKVQLEPHACLQVEAKGHGSRQMCRMDRYGFPRTAPKSQRSVKGFRTGDIVRAVVPIGKKKGKHQGRVAVRSSGSFNVRTDASLVQGISHRHCRIIHRCDGYGYQIHKIATTTQGGSEKLAA